MAVRRGGATPSKVFRGTVPVQKIMRGTVEMWSASPYPLSGSWGPSALPNNAANPGAVKDTHTIVEAGSYTLSHTVTGGGMYRFSTIRTPNGTKNSPMEAATTPPVTVTSTETLSAGALVEFISVAGSPSGTATGTWSIVKN